MKMEDGRFCAGKSLARMKESIETHVMIRCFVVSMAPTLCYLGINREDT